MYVHLNVHSHYSRGWGLPTLEELCRAARAHHMKRLALTDTNGLYGAVFFIQEAREAGPSSWPRISRDTKTSAGSSPTAIVIRSSILSGLSRSAGMV